jgi:putative ABC transport system permease protein
VENYISLEINDLAIALGLMAIAISLSAWQRLGLAGQLAIATGRTVVQLIVVGYILDIIFGLRNPWAVLGIIGIMSTIAAIVARNRISKKIPQVLPMVWGSILISSALTLTYTNFLVIRPATWYEPQYLVPLAGIVLGNAMMPLPLPVSASPIASTTVP